MGGKPAASGGSGVVLVRGELLGDSDGLKVNGGCNRVLDGTTVANVNCSDEFVDTNVFGCGCRCCRCLFLDKAYRSLSSPRLQLVFTSEWFTTGFVVTYVHESSSTRPELNLRTLSPRGVNGGPEV